jgi:hypothetical protein
MVWSYIFVLTFVKAIMFNTLAVAIVWSTFPDVAQTDVVFQDQAREARDQLFDFGRDILSRV